MKPRGESPYVNPDDENDDSFQQKATHMLTVLRTSIQYLIHPIFCVKHASMQ